MTISSSREEELPTKQEGGIVDDTAATNSRIWPGLRNPRIVRVSRAFGGKDRHSKVSTIRGLRDRRVRLSVPTAIQLYDLQNRLGLNQPSKVVDWLLNATQHEIDKLPPLPMMPGNFIQFSQSLMTPQEATPRSPSNHSISKKDGYTKEEARPLSFLSSKSNSKDFSDTAIAKEFVTLPKSAYYSDSSQRNIEREPHREHELEKGSILRSNEVETQHINLHSSQLVTHDPIFIASQSLLPSIVSNAMPYSSYYNSDALNAYEGMQPSQMEIPPLLPSSLSLTTGSQSELRPSGSAILSMFPPYMTVSTAMDARQLGNYIQMAHLASQELQSHPMRTYLLSGSQTMRTFQSNMASKDYMSSQDHHES